MRACRLVFGIVLALHGLCAVAKPVHVALEWPAGLPRLPLVHIHIQAVRTAGLVNNAGPVEGEAAVNGAVLDLSVGVWQVEASAPGYWSQTAEVVVNREGSPKVRLQFWPAAFLHGEIVMGGAEPQPGAIQVRLSAVPASVIGTTTPQTPIRVVEPSPPRAELHCEINAGTWNCPAPAGLFDIRLEVPGYAPRYEWEVNLEPAESTELGRTELRRTASIFGRVLRKDGSNPPLPCRATLWPDMERRGPSAPNEPNQAPEDGPNAKTSYSVTVSQRGYFHALDVVPGRYALAIKCQAASAFRDVQVQPDSETRIDPPLSLDELTLELAVTPKVDSQGQPWTLAVYETGPHYLLIANRAATSADGRWLMRGLMPGKYRIVVQGSDGATWLQKDFDLGKSTGLLSLQVGSLSVAGRVLLSSQPVRARLIFANDSGSGAATLTSDDNGRFHGLLPVAPGARESYWTVDAHVVQPPVTRRVLNVGVQPAEGGASTWVDLELPAVAVHGSVVSPDGKPQPGIQVTVEHSHDDQTTTSTDDAGRFEIPDLVPGKYTAKADSPDGASDKIPFEVTEGSSRELKLVLNPFKGYSFYVVSGQGPVSDAAVQVWIAPGVPRAFVRTDQEGRFEVNLPPRTAEVGLTIGAMGYALKLIRVPVPSASDDSPDAHPITLDTIAGTLVLNFQPPGHSLESFTTLYLVHNGAIQDARTIVGWDTNQSGVNANGFGTINAIEPGDYALCRGDPTNVAALWSGPLPSDRCRKGSLDENGTLTLSPWSSE